LQVSFLRALDLTLFHLLFSTLLAIWCSKVSIEGERNVRVGDIDERSTICIAQPLASQGEKSSLAHGRSRAVTLCTHSHLMCSRDEAGNLANARGMIDDGGWTPALRVTAGTICASAAAVVPRVRRSPQSSPSRGQHGPAKVGDAGAASLPLLALLNAMIGVCAALRNIRHCEPLAGHFTGGWARPN